MMESVQELEPGRALDVGAGQGRNAVWLAQQGWEVTGIDISSAGLAAARDNAERAEVHIQTVQTSYTDYDFGTEQWDLIDSFCTDCHNDESPFVAEGYVFDFAARKEQGTHAKFPLKYKH